MIHPILQNNLDLLDFCKQTGIYEPVNLLLNTGDSESLQKARDLISETDFPADWVFTNKTIIIGNGDVQDYDHGLELAKESGVDGIMIGRGIFKNPWAFLPALESQKLDTKLARLQLLKYHLEMWDETWKDIKIERYKEEFVPNSPLNVNIKNFATMKKFVKMYISNFAGALDLRVKFMELNTPLDMILLCSEEIEKF